VRPRRANAFASFLEKKSTTKSVMHYSITSIFALGSKIYLVRIKKKKLDCSEL
jgi:hypothetical protein